VSSDRIDIEHVAKLARLALTQDEVERFGAQLGTLLEHVSALAKLPTADVPATAQVVPSRNVARADVPQPSLDRAVVLEGAPRAQGVYFRVPRILGETEG
jgi:aspartyl-tRNA(Asn)/glutamyl-tRNA(Gln) amidotransferase subunit C